MLRRVKYYFIKAKNSNEALLNHFTLQEISISQGIPYTFKTRINPEPLYPFSSMSLLDRQVVCVVVKLVTLVTELPF